MNFPQCSFSIFISWNAHKLVILGSVLCGSTFIVGVSCYVCSSAIVWVSVSRATSIFMLNIEQREPGRSNVGLTSCLTLVDLAGIECSTCNALVTCITALGQGSKTVPYRDSKLSILLQVGQLFQFLEFLNIITKLLVLHIAWLLLMPLV